MKPLLHKPLIVSIHACMSGLFSGTAFRRMMFTATISILCLGCKKDKYDITPKPSYTVGVKRLDTTKELPQIPFLYRGIVGNVKDTSYTLNTAYIPKQHDILYFDLDMDGILDYIAIIYSQVSVSGKGASKQYKFMLLEFSNLSIGETRLNQVVFRPFSKEGIRTISKKGIKAISYYRQSQ